MTAQKMEQSKEKKNRGLPTQAIVAVMLLLLAWLSWHINQTENRLIEYESRVDSCLNVIKLQKLQMDAITSIYDVDFEKLKSEKIDSALILLDFYRDRLHYNPQNKYWSVTEHSIEREHFVEKRYTDTIRIETTKTISNKKEDVTDSINP